MVKHTTRTFAKYKLVRVAFNIYRIFSDELVDERSRI